MTVKKGPTRFNAFGEVIEYSIFKVRLLDYKFIIGNAMLLKVLIVRLNDCVEIEKTFPKSFLGVGYEMNDFAFGECGSAKNERGGLYITHVFDGGKTNPSVVVSEVIGYIVFTVCTTRRPR